MLSNSYLTSKQLEIWSMLRKGLSKAEVGRRLGITRQAVYDAEKISLDRVEAALQAAADINSISVIYADATKGVLLGHSPVTKNRVIITFSAKNGVQTWHYEHPECGECAAIQRCRKRLLEEADERGVLIPDNQRSLPPSKLAHIIFSEVIPGLQP